MPDLLIELFSEEIPARMQRQAVADLRRLMTDGLVEAGLTYKGAAAFATPRRLALSVEGLTARSPTLSEERKGPRTDAPEAALEGFLRKAGLRREDLTRRATPKGEVWMARITRPGRPAAAIVAEVLEAAIRGFPWPKSMRWGDGTLRWVRPLHSILCILTDDNGAALVPFEIEGITAGNTTEGHRFHAPGRFPVTSFESYQSGLARAHVVLDGEARALRIRHDAETLAFAQGCEVVADEALLAEVAGLVEWPVALMGTIDERFLSLPAEVLQTSMRTHQKFFSVRNPRTGRIERFITVANRETPDHGAAILAGNRKVLAARLADAAFFWEADLRTARAGMGEWTEALKGVVFHGKLGSQADRVERIAALARALAPLVGADADQAETAARLAKADLRSAMVGEFPELQGVMGRYYALAAGEPEAVADAVRDHWSPKGESDTVPAAPVSVAVALADKLDTLTGFWAIDEKPTGSKDPFALRRAALGVIRLLLQNDLRISLMTVFKELAERLNAAAVATVQEDGFELASGPYAQIKSEWDLVALAKEGRPRVVIMRSFFDDQTAADLLSFFHDRLKVHLREEGIRHDVIDAVLAQPGNDDLVLVVRRATALSAFLKTEDGENLTQGLKRAANLLAQAEEKDGVEYSFGPEPKLAETDEERALFAALDAAEPAIMAAAQAEDFPAAMAAIAALRAPIDAFFEAVQINTDNRIVRRNRLNLLHRIRAAGQGIADFARIEG